MTADYSNLDKPTRYSNLLTFQFQKQKAIKTINLFCSCFLQQIDICKLIMSAFNIETAVGKQLDMIGDYIGLKRPFLNGVLVSDDSYRYLLKLKIVLNYNTHTDYSITNSLYTFFGNDVVLIDNRNMSMEYILKKIDNQELLTILSQNKNLFPAPTGVLVSIVVHIPVDSLQFGFYDTINGTIPEMIGGFYVDGQNEGEGVLITTNNIL